MNDNTIFADVFNQYMFHGEEVLVSDSLSSADTAFFTIPYGEAGTDVTVQRFRDILKLSIAKKDNAAVYLLLGIENQSELHFAMPVRNMLYDALAYTSQVEMTAKAHKAEQKKYHVSSAEYLSGFYRDDRLIPVVTLVVYFGADIWNVPKSLYEMLSCKDAKLLQFVADYRLNLIAPAQMSDAEIGQFKTSFREVMLFIKYSKDKQKLRNLVAGNGAFRKIDRKAARVMSSVTGSNLQFDEEESVDMCLAIDGMREDAREEGMRQAAVETAQRMLHAGKYAFEEIAAISGLAIEKVKELQSDISEDVQ